MRGFIALPRGISTKVKVEPNQSGPVSNGNEGLLHIPISSRLKVHCQIQFSFIPRTLNGFKDWYLILRILFNIIHSFEHS